MDSEVARKRKWEECGSDEKSLGLAFLPSVECFAANNYKKEGGLNFVDPE